jgi:hypothetical protein
LITACSIEIVAKDEHLAKVNLAKCWPYFSSPTSADVMRSTIALRVLVLFDIPKNPGLQNISKLQVVIVHHHHVTVAMDAEIGQQNKLRISTRLLE